MRRWLDRIGSRARLTAILFAVGLVPMVVVGLLGYLGARSQLRDDAGTLLTQVAFDAGDAIDRALFERTQDIKLLAQTDTAVSMDPRRLTLAMNSLVGNVYAPVYKMMVVADPRGRVVATSTLTIDDREFDNEELIGQDVGDQPWFEEAMTEGDVFEDEGEAGAAISPPRERALLVPAYGRGIASEAMVFARPIRSGDRQRVIGVWANLFNWNVARELLSSIAERSGTVDDATSLQLFVTTHDDGRLIAASGEQADVPVGEDLSDSPLVREAHEHETGIFFLEGPAVFGEGDRLAGHYHSDGFATYPGFMWATIATEDKGEALAGAADLGWLTLWIGLAAAALIGVVAFFLARTISARGRRLGKVSADVQEGAQVVSASAAEILSTVNQHTHSASEQSATMTQISSSVEQVRVTAEQAAQRADEVSRQAESSVQVGDEGSLAVESIAGGMAEIQERVEGIARDIVELSERTHQIGEITATVSDLADQSNLLAFNATIEAAKAGEHGAGFAVVADEVRNLAEQSKQATEQVRSILGEIRKATDAAVRAAEQGTATVQAGTERTQRAGEVIAHMAAINRAAEQAAKQIAALARQQSTAMDEIAPAMSETSQTTRQFVDGSRETQAAAEQLEAVARELRDLAEATTAEAR